MSKNTTEEIKIENQEIKPSGEGEKQTNQNLFKEGDPEPFMFDHPNYRIIKIPTERTYSFYLATNSTIVGTVDINGVTKIGDGGTTNYSEFEADGTLEFIGSATVWKDINLGSASLGAGATAPDLVQVGTSGVFLRGFDGAATTEQLFFELELQHDYKEGSDITFHIHNLASTTDVGNVNWQLSYIISRSGDTTSSATTISKVQAYDGTQWKRYRTDFTAITGTNFKTGDQIICRLFRDPTASDTYGADALVETVGFHYECDTVGSRTITSK